MLIGCNSFTVMSNVAVQLSHISKKYVVHHEKPTLVENIFKRTTSEAFWALRNINLTIHKGEKIGIIGPNGSGKTTLLKIIAGITAPTTGAANIYGRVVSLIELKAGFHPDLTGEENILLNGLLIGMSKDEIRNKITSIINFADIGSFIDAPFYTYSNGMALRLGFSIAVHAEPEILVLDENMAVGDEKFGQKSQKKMEQFFRQNKTIILVSHDLDFVKDSCTLTILMTGGKITKMGKSPAIVKYYRNTM